MAIRKIVPAATSKSTPSAESDDSADPPVMSMTAFVALLEGATDHGRVKNATTMLRQDRFQLFNDVADDHVTGVVKSQSVGFRIYACRIDKTGRYMCCTQNLNRCGSLQKDRPCKHLVLLMIGLVQARRIEAGMLSPWVRATRGKPPVLDKDAMSATFVKFKGAEAGEIDWRPTETIPEDYYAL